MKKSIKSSIIGFLIGTILLSACNQAATSIIEPSVQSVTTSTPPITTVTPLNTFSPDVYIPDVAPEVGILDAGIYTLVNIDEAGFNVRFTVPTGWAWNGRFLSKGGIDLPDGAAIFFFSGPVQVYADPCHWAEGQSTSASGLGVIVALLNQQMRSATTPIDRGASSLGLANGWPGMAVGLTVPADLDFADCDAGQFRSWGPESYARYQQGPGQRDFVWAVDLSSSGVSGGQHLIIDAASFPGTPAEVMSEIEAILGSIIVGHWG